MYFCHMFNFMKYFVVYYVLLAATYWIVSFYSEVDHSVMLNVSRDNTAENIHVPQEYEKTVLAITLQCVLTVL